MFKNCIELSLKKIGGINESIFKTHPELLDEWNKEKNMSVSPKNLTKGSSFKAHWTCKVLPNHMLPKRLKVSSVTVGHRYKRI